ncbi:hypothetical protein Tco_0087968 [Tanacetum coccineum]
MWMKPKNEGESDGSPRADSGYFNNVKTRKTTLQWWDVRFQPNRSSLKQGNESMGQIMKMETVMMDDLDGKEERDGGRRDRR